MVSWELHCESRQRNFPLLQPHKVPSPKHSLHLYSLSSAPSLPEGTQGNRGLGHLVWSWPVTNIHHQVALFPSWAPKRAESGSKLRGARPPRTDLQGAIY